MAVLLQIIKCERNVFFFCMNNIYSNQKLILPWRRQPIHKNSSMENVNEDWGDCRVKTKELFRDELRIEENIEIDRAHRTGLKKEENSARKKCFKTEK